MSVDNAQAIAALLIVLVAVLLAIAVGQAAKKRGRSAVLWTILALVFNPLFSWIVLVILKNKTKSDSEVVASTGL